MSGHEYLNAVEDYQRARRQAAIQQLLARITGTSEKIELLSYEEVRQRLRATEKSSQFLTEIPLDAIVGSVDRYHDFTRKFLPRKSINRSRWARVMALARGLSGFPAIEVYQIGEVYFVKDGNHRVSVARQLGYQTIQAFVTEVETIVPVTSDLNPDTLIIKAELVKFFEQTHLDTLRPEADLSATTPGAYPTLIEHINVHRYFMGVNEQREIPFHEAATHWYNEVYSPVVSIIRRQGLLRDFPGRTETDLYLWIARHRTALEKEVGWDISSEDVAADLSETHTESPRRKLLVLLGHLIKRSVPAFLLDGPPPGTWRLKRRDTVEDQQLFADILVAVDNSQTAWDCLDLAVKVAQFETSKLHGIHIHETVTEKTREEHNPLQQAFAARCREGDVDQFDFHIVAGEVGKTLCKYARFTDLVMLPLNHPPGDRPIDRLESGLRTLIRSCPLPILTVPGPSVNINRAILAYDGSPKAKEAMYIAAYISGQWNTHLTVLTSSQGLANPKSIQHEAQSYLSGYHISADFQLTDRSIPKEIKRKKDLEEIDLVLIGGYGTAPVLEVVLGSVVDQVLREIQLPTLICR